MKKVIIFMFVLLFLGSFAFAQVDEGVWWGTNYMPGNFVYGGTFGFEADPWPTINEYVGAAGFTLSGKGEIILFKPQLGEISPFDFGIAAKVRTGVFFSINTLTNDSSSTPNYPVGVAAMATAHMGFKGFNIHFSDFGDTPTVLFSYLSRLDYYINMGLAFDISPFPGNFPLGLAMATGLNYFVNDNFMVTSEYTYWNGFSGVAIGGAYKIGGGQKTKTVDVNLDPLYYQMYLGQFYAMYWYSFYAGGFYFDDSNYKEGQGTEWTLTSKKDPEDILTIKKSLLKVNSDGTRWWKVKYEDSEDDIIFEYKIDNKYRPLSLRFRDADTGKVKEYTPTDKDAVRYNMEDMRSISEDEYKEWKVGTENIKTPAGTFKTDHLVYKKSGNHVEWWISDNVPGQMVKYFWDDGSDIVTGTLTGLSKGNKSELKK